MIDPVFAWTALAALALIGLTALLLKVMWR